MKKVLNIFGIFLGMSLIICAVTSSYSFVEGIGYILLSLPLIPFFRNILSEYNLEKKKRIWIYSFLIFISFVFIGIGSEPISDEQISEIKQETKEEVKENKKTENKDTEKTENKDNQKLDKNKTSLVLQNLYGQWENKEKGYDYNFALNESYYFEYIGDLNTATTNDGYNAYNYKVVSEKKDDADYIDYFGKGYYILLELSDNEGLISQQLIYTEKLGSDTIYSLDRIAVDNEFKGKFTNQEKYTRLFSQEEASEYIFTEEEEETAQKGTYSSREIIEKSFIGEYKPLPDYKDNQGVKLDTFTYVPERYVVNGHTRYEAGNEIVCEKVSAEYNDPNYNDLNGKGYYFVIKLNKEYSTTEFDEAVLMYKEKLNDDVIMYYVDNNYTGNVGNFKEGYRYYMSRKYPK